MKNKKKFISIVWGYHKQIFSFNKEQNYHMMPFEVMKEQGYQCELYAIDSHVTIEDDPNFIDGVKVVYYKNIFEYLWYLFRNRTSIIYSNSLTIRTLLVGIIGKNTFFYSHSYPFGHCLIKKVIIRFFYKFFTKVRVNNSDEVILINQIKNDLAFKCPLAISKKFYIKDLNNRFGALWIGNITSIKKPEFLIETAYKLKKQNIDFVIKIIGEDRYNENGLNFGETIKQNGLEDYIKLLGVKNHIEIKDELSKSLIYINTSISEGQCLAVYEGALAGNILCLQNILSFPSVFKENALYHNGPEDLAKNIIYLLDSKNGIISEKIKINQETILKNYDYHKIKKLLKEMFNIL